MKNSILIVIRIAILLIFVQSSIAQELKRCATFQFDSLANLKNPQRAFNKQLFENQVTEFIAKNQTNARVGESIIRIPVVVHIVHNNASGIIGGTGNTNISDEQVFSQIKVLNEDYRRKEGTLGYNTNPVGADAGIEFYLALRDPEGNPTNGITRSYTPQASFNIFNEQATIAALSDWDPDHYFNIWVTTLQNGYLGYTQFPGGTTIDGLDADDGPANTDGIYIDYRAFGKKLGTAASGLYSFGRTATHEIGHFFGLRHTWGDAYCGTDYCDDTPQAASANQSKFCRDVFSTCSGVRTRNMIENYLDYSPDSCMNIFTMNQVSRMNAVMELSKRRRRLINYAKSVDLPAVATLQVTALPNPAENNIQLQVLFPDFQNFSVSLYDNAGRLVKVESYSDLPSTVIQISMTDMPPGMYLAKVATATESQIKRIFLRK